MTLPSALSPNLAAVNRACTRAQADAASACPDRSRVGTAIIDSPLQPQPVRGPVYIAFNTDAPLPGLVVILPAPVGVRLDSAIEISAAGIKNTFAGNPDLPVGLHARSRPGRGPGGALSLNRDLCDEDTDRTMSVTLFAHNGKLVSFERELATPSATRVQAHDPPPQRAPLAARGPADGGARRTGHDLLRDKAAEATEPRQGATARACRRAARSARAPAGGSCPRRSPVRSARRPSPGEACGRGACAESPG